MTVEVAVLGFPSLIVLKYGLYGRKATLNGTLTELRSCVTVEVAVLGFPSLIVFKSNSKHWFTASFLQPLSYVVTP